MYFINTGIIDIYLTTNKKVKAKNADDTKNADDKKTTDEIRIARLSDGTYFGEIGLITKLKRTATAKASDYTTLAYLQRDSFEEIRKEFPQVYINFKSKIKKYTDVDFNFRR